MGEAGGGDASLHAQRLDALKRSNIRLKISSCNVVAYSAAIEI